MGPILAGDGVKGIQPWTGTRPKVGRKPVTPQRSDGLRIEPRLSVPIAKLQSAAATADAAPALDPPDGSAVFQGLRTMRSEEHTSELQSLMRISYAVFCLKQKRNRRPHVRMNARTQ